MTRSNKLLLGILTFVVVCVVGYALFSETTTITGTATASGTFEIVGSCQTGVPSELVSGVEYQFDDANFVENGYKSSSCMIDGDKGTFSVEFEYPSALRYFTVKFSNKGTITAVWGQVTTTIDDICIDDNCKNNNPGYITDLGYEYINMFDGVEPVGIQIGNGDIIPYDKITPELEAEFTDENGNYIVKPGNSVYGAIRTSFYSGLGNPNGGSFEASTTGTITFPFTQVTE